MYKNLMASILCVGALFSYQASASEENFTLEQLAGLKDPVAKLEALSKSNPENVSDLCDEIKDPGFYDRAKELGIRLLKRNKLINFCEGVKFETAKIRKVEQKEKATEKEREVVKLKKGEQSREAKKAKAKAPQRMVKLKPVEFAKGKQDVQQKQAELKRVQAMIIENAQKLGRKKEFEVKLVKVQKEINVAKEAYDNLSAIILVMREDMKPIGGFKIFKPNDHDDDSPEEYLAAFNAAWVNENVAILEEGSKEQIRRADELLQEANANLAAAREDLERINREMRDLYK